MKKVITTTVVLFAALIALAVTHLWVYQNDGTVTPFDVTTVDSVSLVAPLVCDAYPNQKRFSSEGGQFSITLQSNKSWTATVSDPTRLRISQASGIGNSLITCIVQPNNGGSSYTESVTFLFEGGETKSVFITVEAYNHFMALLNASAYIVYDLPSMAYDRISDRVVLDLRRNDETIVFWDWNVPSCISGGDPDPFFGETDWTKVVVNNGWG
ncbi:MAG: BACON domain-containing protein, partial [Paludibacteraceae bacterium]|nr:BACON domain-containing protein [Paludibacteraceae bacterium]